MWSNNIVLIMYACTTFLPLNNDYLILPHVLQNYNDYLLLVMVHNS